MEGIPSANWAFIDVAIIVGFIGYAIGSGLKAKDQAGQNLEEYFLAGRSLPGWKAGLSMAATQFAADTPLVVTGLVATLGVFSLWRFSIYALSFLLMGFLLAPSWRKAGVLTDAELTEVRYGSKAAAFLRGVKAIYLGTIFNCFVLGMVLLAATRIAEPFLIWNEWLPEMLHSPFVSLVGLFDRPLTATQGSPELQAILGANNLISILVIVLVTTFYSTTGGLRSVVNTDVAQVFLMFFGTFVFAWVVVDQAGGFGGLSDSIRERFASGGPGGIAADEILGFTPSVAKDVSMALLVAYAIQWIAQINGDGTGYLAQRSMACKSDDEAKKAAVIFTFAQVFVRTLMWIPLAVGLLIVFPPDLSLVGDAIRIERENTYILGIARLDLPWGVRGLLVTAMLAALASTVDTHLNWGSSYWTNDIYRRFICQGWLKREPNPKNLVWVARGANILILLIGLLVMTQLGSIGAAWEKSLLLGAGIGVVLVLRWLWWRMTAWGELASFVISAGLTVLVAVGAVEGLGITNNAEQMIFVASISTIAAIVVSMVQGHESMDRLVEFYRRARPPGFWGPVSAKFDSADAGADQGRLWSGLQATFICAFSLFCLLTAMASQMIDSPEPTWFPFGAGLWRGLVLVIGLALVPVWYRIGFRQAVPVATITDAPRPSLGDD